MIDYLGLISAKLRIAENAIQDVESRRRHRIDTAPSQERRGLDGLFATLTGKWSESFMSDDTEIEKSSLDRKGFFH